MKKRLISLVMTIVMLASLCTTIGTSASADANVTTVTLASGDTVYGLCMKYGINYNANKELIMALNGFTSENQFKGLAVGSQVILPVSNNAASLVASAMTTAATTAATVAATTTTEATTATGSVPAGDYVSYYIVSYTMQQGDSIGAIYSNWGLNYKTYDNQIRKLNGITNYNNIAAGKTLLLPTTSPALANAAYYTVLGHVVKSGETAYDVICGSYGLNLTQSQGMVMAINNIQSLDAIRAGSTLYIPLTGLVSTSTTVSTSTGTSTTVATVNTSANYNLVTQTPTNGTFALTVDGTSVTTAQAGKTVNVIATPNTGYALDTVKVVKVGDSATTVAVNNNSFIMPSYSVIVSVTFKQTVAYNINVDSSANGTVAAMINGVSVNKGYVGSTVSVRAIPKAGFKLENVRVTYNDYKDSVAVQNNQFVMPSTGVTVTASFVTDPDYDPNIGCAIYVDANFCTVTTSVGGKQAQYAKDGDTVKLDITPYTNYTVESIKVYNSDFTKVLATDKLTFTMPDAPVNVVITVKPTPNAEFAISVVDPVNGKVAVTVDDASVKSAKVGQVVKVTPTETKPAYNSIITVYKTNDSSVAVPITENEDGTATFTMPDYAVTVRVKFYTYYNVKTHASNGQYGSYGIVSANDQSLSVSKAGAGVELKVGFINIQSGYSVSEILLIYADGSTYTLEGTNFIMPDCDVTVRVKFAKSTVVRAYAISENDSDKATVYPCWGNTYTIGGKTLNDLKASSIDVDVASGSNVTVTPDAAVGCVFYKIVYTYKDKLGAIKSGVVTEKNPTTLKYQFTMPEMAEGGVLELRVYFKEIQTYAINHDYTNKGTDQSNANHSKGTFSFLTAYDVADHAAKDTKIYITSGATIGYKANLEGVKIYRASDGADVTLNAAVNYDKIQHSFFMPDYDINVYVPFTESMFWVKLEKAIDYGTGKAMGELTAIIGGTHFTEETMTKTGGDKNHVRTVFDSGVKVQLVNTSETGYTLNSTTPFEIYQADANGNATGSDLSKSLMIDGSTDTFILPNFNVVVRAKYQEEVVNVIAEATEHGTFKVPAQVEWSKSFDITEIYPDTGYQLKEILVSYTDYNGVPHKEDKIEAPSKTITLVGGGRPRTDVTVKVVFEALKNPVNIKYIFATEDMPYIVTTTPVGNYYDVSMAMNTGNGIESITVTRDLVNAWKTNTHVDTIDKTNGIPTGALVRIERSAVDQDTNFDIVGITATNDGKNVDVSTDGTYYYFYMPFVVDGTKFELNVSYGRYTEGTFYLSNKATGDEQALDVAYTVGGSPVTKAKPGELIVADITVPADGKFSVETVTAVYRDSDGNPQKIDATLDSGKWKFTIPVMPLEGVAIEYTAKHDKFSLTYSAAGENAAGSTAVFKVDGAADTTAAWGKTVTVELTPDASKKLMLSKVYVNGSEIDGSSFVMPKADVTVTADFVEVPFVVTLSDPNPEVQATIKVAGQEYTNTAPANNGVEVKFTIDKVPSGYEVDTVKVNGGTYAPDANGVYTFTMGAADATITCTFKLIERLVKISYTADSASEKKCTFTRLRDSVSTPIDGTTTKLAVNDTVSYTIPEGYVLASMVVNYTNADGGVGGYTGNVNNKSFTITDVPKSEIEIVTKLIPDPYKTYGIAKKVVFDPTSLNSTGTYDNAVDLTITGGVDGEGKAIANATVSFTLKVRYDLKYVDKSVVLSYTDANGNPITKNIDNFYGGSFDSSGMVKEYYGSFLMPDAATEVSVTVKEATDFTISGSTYVAAFYKDEAKTTGFSGGKIGDTFYVLPYDRSGEGLKIKSVTVFYTLFDSTKETQSKDVSDEYLTSDTSVFPKGTHGDLYAIKVSEPSMYNRIQVVVNYVPAV